MQLRDQGNLALHLLANSKDTNLETLMSYPLSSVPYSLATADGFFDCEINMILVRQPSNGHSRLNFQEKCYFKFV